MKKENLERFYKVRGILLIGLGTTLVALSAKLAAKEIEREERLKEKIDEIFNK